MEERLNEFSPQWVELKITKQKLRDLVSTTRWPNNSRNSNLLSKEEWETRRQLLIEAGDSLKIYKNAELISTFYNKPYGASYLVWLKFIDAIGTEQVIDIYLNKVDFFTGGLNAEKHIDSRSPLCSDILKSMTTSHSIPTNIAKLLPTMGSVRWNKPVEEKVQYKLNSFLQSTFFETACNQVGVQYKQLDEFDNYLYRGDPGCLADYDLVFDNGQKVRVDLKLLWNLETLPEQNSHDAELLIASNLRYSNFKYFVVKDIQGIENNDQFKALLTAFANIQSNSSEHFVKINHIDTDTGYVDFSHFPKKFASFQF